MTFRLEGAGHELRRGRKEMCTEFGMGGGPHQELRKRWEDSVKMGFVEVGCENGTWKEVAEDDVLVGFSISNVEPLCSADRELALFCVYGGNT